ncbi:hypothetical protein J1N35_015121, partial [Gossypium stocksii]
RVYGETDCLELVSLLQRRSNSVMDDALVLHIRCLCSRDWLIPIRYVSRMANRPADAMAKLRIPGSWTACLFDRSATGVVLLVAQDI